MTPFPEKRYKVIVADPPWEYRNKNTGGSMVSGASAKYPTMATDDICNLPVKEISEDNCVLFLWTTTPFLQEGLTVMKSWEFKYKTAIYWNKKGKLGLGFWFRGQVEVCLFGIRGKVPAFRSSTPNFIETYPGKHSEKPQEFFKMIEKELERGELFPKIELFARKKRKGWDSWGNEV